MLESMRRRTARLKEALDRFDRVRVSQGLGLAMATLTQTITRWFFFRGDCFLLARSLEGAMPTAHPIDGLTLKEIQSGDLGLFTGMKNPSDLLWYESLLAKGRSCIAARLDDELAAYGWFTSQVEPAVERTYVPLAPGDVFIFDLFTRPEFRRRGIQSAVLGRILALGREKGYTRALSLVRVNNAPSLNLHTKLGFQTICRLSQTRVLTLVRFYFRPNLFGKAGDVIRWM